LSSDECAELLRPAPAGRSAGTRERDLESRGRLRTRDAAVNRHEIYRLIAAEKATYPVCLLCRLLGVGHSAFYAWLAVGAQRAVDRQRRDRTRTEVLRQAWIEHRCAALETITPDDR
jgi:hypothetical protein